MCSANGQRIKMAPGGSENFQIRGEMIRKLKEFIEIPITKGERECLGYILLELRQVFRQIIQKTLKVRGMIYPLCTGE